MRPFWQSMTAPCPSCKRRDVFLKSEDDVTSMKLTKTSLRIVTYSSWMPRTYVPQGTPFVLVQPRSPCHGHDAVVLCVISMMSCRKNTWVMPPARSETCVDYLLNYVNRLLGHFCEIQNVLTIFGLPYKLGSNVPHIMFMLDVQLIANASFHVLSAATRSFFTHSLAGDDVETWSGFWTISAAHMQAASSVWSPWTL